MAKRFQFKLQNVLKHRERRENEELFALGNLNRKRQELQSRLDATQQRSEACQHELHAKNQRGQTHAEQELYLRHLHQLRKEIENLQLQIKHVDLALVEQQQKTVKASVDKKAIEKLKETQSQRVSEDNRREEAQLLDEAATLRYKVPSSG